MAATNETTNLHLPVFTPTDKPSWLGDFNGAMNSIDTAVGLNTGEIGGVKTTAEAASDKANANEAKIAEVETKVTGAITEVTSLDNRLETVEDTLDKVQEIVNAINPIRVSFLNYRKKITAETAWSSNRRLVDFDISGFGHMVFAGGRMDFSGNYGTVLGAQIRLAGAIKGNPFNLNSQPFTINSVVKATNTSIILANETAQPAFVVALLYNATYNCTYILAPSNKANAIVSGFYPITVDNDDYLTFTLTANLPEPPADI